MLFLIKDEKANFYHRPWKTREKTILQSFWTSSNISPLSEHAFSDEKTFYQDQMVISQNNHQLALSPQDVPLVMNTKYPVHIMVFGVVTSSGDVIPPSSHMAFSSTLKPTCSDWRWYYLPTPPLGQDMTQGQFLSGV